MHRRSPAFPLAPRRPSTGLSDNPGPYGAFPRNVGFDLSGFSQIVIATAILWSLLSKDPEEHVILNPTDTQPGLVTYNDVPVEIGESDNLPSSASDANLPSSVSDAEWNLTLVNKWNPLPENYEIDLVEVPGGEKVAESRAFQS